MCCVVWLWAAVCHGHSVGQYPVLSLVPSQACFCCLTKGPAEFPALCPAGAWLCQLPACQRLRAHCSCLKEHSRRQHPAALPLRCCSSREGCSCPSPGAKSCPTRAEHPQGSRRAPRAGSQAEVPEQGWQEPLGAAGHACPGHRDLSHHACAHAGRCLPGGAQLGGVHRNGPVHPRPGMQPRLPWPDESLLSAHLAPCISCPSPLEWSCFPCLLPVASWQPRAVPLRWFAASLVCVQLRSPQHRKDMELLEQVQRRPWRR